MKPQRKLLVLLFCLIASTSLKAQIQLDHLSFKGYSALGFGGFFNFAVPVSDANYVTGEIGLDVFSSNGENVALAPLLLGYRYTLDGSGTGF